MPRNHVPVAAEARNLVPVAAEARNLVPVAAVVQVNPLVTPVTVVVAAAETVAVVRVVWSLMHKQIAVEAQLHPEGAVRVGEAPALESPTILSTFHQSSI